MCGISGVLIDSKRTLADTGLTEEHIRRMRRALAHRGPNGDGEHFAHPVYFGHNRLSIIDLSDAGKQPMTRNGTQWITFNGEIYNYVELRAELQRAGLSFRTQTDTEVILAAYEHWGDTFVEHLRGMFAFALFDNDKKTLLLVRDRLGIKPLFYTMGAGYVAFASEIKGLLQLGITRRPNEPIIHDYLVRGLYDHTDETFFEGIYQVTPGHTLQFSADLTMEDRPYWDLADASHAGQTTDWVGALRAEVAHAVRIHLRSDVPVGLHLSGGLDSNTLAVFMRDALHASGGSLHSFTLAFVDPRFDESPRAKETCAALGCAHTVTQCSVADVERLVQRGVEQQDQPFGGIPTLAYLHMAFSVRAENIIVVLEGQGGDELFAGYGKYAIPFLRDLHATRSPLFARELAAYCERSGRSPQAVLALITESGTRHVHTDDTTAVQPSVLRPAFRDAHALRTHSFAAPFDSHLRNAQYQDVRYHKLPRVLRFNDHMTMAAGLELRVPLLDHKVVELAFALPAAYLLRDGQSKWIERELTAGVLPDTIRLRPKSSVVTPQTPWLQQELRALVESILSSESFAKRPYWDAAAVRAAYTAFLAEPSPANSFFVWQWVNLELWLRTYIDPPALPAP